MPDLKDKSRFNAWLNRITVNKCKDFLKKKTPVVLTEETKTVLETDTDNNVEDEVSYYELAVNMQLIT